MTVTDTEFGWVEYNCTGCGIYKKTKRRDWDGISLCKKCSKNKPLTKFTKKRIPSEVRN